MGGIGIAIGVDAREVKRAKQDVDALNHSLKETEEFENFELGKEGLGESERRLKQITEDVRRLKGLVRSGEKQGGFLKTDEFKEAAILSKRIRETWGGFSNDIAKARQELGALVREKAKLEKVEREGKYESPQDFTRRRERISEIEAEIEARRKGYADLRKVQGKLEPLAGEGVGYTDTIGGYGRVQPNFEKAIGKALRVAGGLVGGFSIYNYLNQALSQATEYQPALTDFQRRAGGYEPNTYMGYTLQESLGTADAINRRTGFRGDDLAMVAGAAKRFARGAGIDASVLTSFLGETYGAVGGPAEKSGRLVEGLYDVVKRLGAMPRVEEYLSGTSSILDRISKGMGGQELSEDAINRVLTLQAGLWSLPGQIGKGASGAQLIGQVDAAIRSGGGSRGQQLFMFQALAGGKMGGIEDFASYQRLLEEGLSGEGSLRKVLSTARGRYGTDASGGLSTLGQMALKNTFGLTWRQTQALLEAEASGDYSPEKVQAILASSGSSRADAEVAMGTKGGQTRATVAEFSAEQERIGERILPWVNQFKEGVTKFVEGIEKMNPLKAMEGIVKSGPAGILAGGATGGWEVAAGIAMVQGGAAFADKLAGLRTHDQLRKMSTEELANTADTRGGNLVERMNADLAYEELVSRKRAGVSDWSEQPKQSTEVTLRIEAAEWLKRLFDFSPGTAGPPETVR